MFIESVRIKNLRAYQDETVRFDPYTCLVGANGAGKSTVLCALNIFFRETENSATNLSTLDREDFHNQNTEDPIEITVTFSGLSPEAEADFAGYFRQGSVIVTAKAVYDQATGSAAVKQFGNRQGFNAFKDYFRLLGDGARVAELTAEYQRLCEIFELPANAKTKDQMSGALRGHEAERPEDCDLIPSEDQFYGVTQGQGLLRKHIQWVYVPAVKDAAGEQTEGKNTALGRLLARTVRAQVNFADRLTQLRSAAEEQYHAMLAAEQEVLDRISGDLQQRLAEWSHPDATAQLRWHQDARSVKVEEPTARLLAGDGEFQGSIARFGHGLQRSYIIALLQGLTDQDDPNSPRLLLGIEEPELYQHPPQARHLASVLHQLGDRNAQVIVSTHSPYFVDGAGFHRVRLVRKVRDQGSAVIRECPLTHLQEEYARVTGERPAPLDSVIAKLHQVMQPHLSEMFFSPKLVLVEGLEDAAYIHAWLIITGKWNAYRKTGAHIVPVNGKSELIRPLIIADRMEIPAFVSFDCDGDKLAAPNKPEREAELRAAHTRDNVAILTLAGGDANFPFPAEPCWGGRYVAWPADLGRSVAADAGEQWQRAGQAASAQLGGVGGLQKNTLHIGGRLRELERLHVALPTLDRLCDAVIAFGNDN